MERSITLTEIADRISDKTGTPRNLNKNVVKALCEVAEEELNAGRAFQIPGLVKFSFGVRKAIRKGTPTRNPWTGEEGKSEGRPASVRIKARVLAKAQKAAPSAASKVGKAIIGASK